MGTQQPAPQPKPAPKPVPAGEAPGLGGSGPYKISWSERYILRYISVRKLPARTHYYHTPLSEPPRQQNKQIHPC